MFASTTIHPTEVKGKYQIARDVVRAVLILAILGLPWITLHGHQALLLDIAHRKFAVFGNLFFAQDVPLLFLLVINFVLGIALVTALFGRVWCGWLCPQSVFIDGIFRRIERWTEGNAEVRRKLDKAPMSASLFFRKSIKWFLFAFCTMCITHSILAIFIGSDRLLQVLSEPISENLVPFFFIAISNLVMLIDFGLLREQFCMIACPYGKFQSVLQDQYSVSVAYQASRQDCVDCLRCVRVCPTGIDIRKGSQLECIACTACMDACDDVMHRLKKPLHLIGYFSEAQVSGMKQRWFRPRIAVYSALILLFGGVAVYQIVRFKPFEVMVYKTKGAPFTVLNPKSPIEKITNLFSAELSNKSSDPLEIELSVRSNKSIELIMPNNPIVLKEGEVRANPFTVEFDKEELNLGSTDGVLVIRARNLNTHQEWLRDQPIHLIGPF